jgi:hypothetical protein
MANGQVLIDFRLCAGAVDVGLCRGERRRTSNTGFGGGHLLNHAMSHALILALLIVVLATLALATASIVLVGGLR